MRRSCPRPVGQGRHLDEPGPLQQQLPGRLVERDAVDEVPGGRPRVRRGRRRVRRSPRAGPRAATPGGSGPATAAARAVAGGRPRRSARRRRPSRPAREARCSDASAMVTEQPCSRARSATAPRGSTPCASAPRSLETRSSSPSPQSAWTIDPARRARRDVGRHRSGPGAERTGRHEPGGAVHRPVLGRQPLLERLDTCGQETKGLDDVPHGLFEVRLLAVRRPSGAVPARAQPVERPGPPALVAAGGQRRR